MSTKRSLGGSGFTVIEVLIVMAIAGLIMLIVLMAIPTLTRNSRNNQRKQDVTAILATIGSYELRNSGNFCSPITGGGCDPALFTNTKLTFYNASTNVTAIPQTAATATPFITTIPSPDVVEVYNYHHCEQDPATGQTRATNSGAGYLDVVAVYELEGNGAAYSFHCQQL